MIALHSRGGAHVGKLEVHTLESVRRSYAESTQRENKSTRGWPELQKGLIMLCLFPPAHP